MMGPAEAGAEVGKTWVTVLLFGLAHSGFVRRVPRTAPRLAVPRGG